jgi:hypothetical protein
MPDVAGSSGASLFALGSRNPAHETCRYETRSPAPFDAMNANRQRQATVRGLRAKSKIPASCAVCPLPLRWLTRHVKRRRMKEPKHRSNAWMLQGSPIPGKSRVSSEVNKDGDQLVADDPHGQRPACGITGRANHPHILEAPRMRPILQERSFQFVPPLMTAELLHASWAKKCIEQGRNQQEQGRH